MRGEGKTVYEGMTMHEGMIHFTRCKHHRIYPIYPLIYLTCKMPSYYVF